MLLSLGASAAAPLLDFAERRFPDEDADESLRTLGEVIRTDGELLEEGLLRRVADFCAGAFGRDDVSKGGFVIALSKLCGYTSYGRGRFEEVLGREREGLWKAPYSFEILEGLGILAGSPNAEAEHQRELTDLFLRILNLTPPEEIGRRRETEDGTVYEFGREIEFDTLMVPAAVRGLERVCASEQAPIELREQVVKQFLVLWEGVSNVRIVWSPAGVEALISAISTAGRCEMVEVGVRIRLGRALLNYVNKIAVIRALGEIGSQEDRSGELEPFSVEVARALLREWELCERQDDERKKALLWSVARIASSTSLNARRKAVREMREEAMHALFQGLRENIPDTALSLGMLRDCPDLSREMRSEIGERLQKAVGLVRTENYMWYR
jgi:hypothetical protein